MQKPSKFKKYKKWALMRHLEEWDFYKKNPRKILPFPPHAGVSHSQS
jgi:hypothetical protein